MKLSIFPIKIIGVVAVIGLLSFGAFQNCGEGIGVPVEFEIDSSSNGLDEGPHHEVSEEVVVPPPTKKNIRLADRFYVQDFLSYIFLPESEELMGVAENRVADKINALTIDQSFAYGGPCRPQNEPGLYPKSVCSLNTINVATLPSSTAIQEVYARRVCEYLSEDITALKWATFKVGVEGLDQTPDSKGIIKSYKLFYPGLEPNQETLESLKRVADEAYELSGESGDSWRFLFYGLCLSSGWRVL